MKMQKFFLNYCEWLYQSAVGAGLLFLIYIFLQNTSVGIRFLNKGEPVLIMIAGGMIFVRLLMEWAEAKNCRFRIGLASFAIFITGGAFFIRYTGNYIVFWYFTGLVIICTVVSLAVHKIWCFSVLKGLLVSVQVVLLILLTLMKKTVPVWCAGIILTVVLLFLVERRTKGRKEVLGLLPLFVPVMFLLCRIPEKENPMDWSWVRSAWLVAQEKAEMLMVDIENLFWNKNNFAFSGYGNSGKVGGFVFDTNHVQLHITGSGTKNPLYLTGRVYESYDGEKWEVVPNEALRDGQMDDSLLNALEQSIYAEKRNELTSFSEISVEYRYIRTKDLFHELNTTDLYGTVPACQEGFLWTMKHSKKKGFSYSIRFLEINEESNEVKALYRQQAWKENVTWDEEGSLQETEIYKTDVLLPDEISHRVYELAYVITENAENDYDRMVLLSDYLKGYTYTKTPPPCPEGREITDYFLFESKSGYCEHFATALAVLGRCVGIPTRYVQGFVTTDTGETYSNIELTGTKAHAWTEFYIEHIGWVRMDATPGYGKTFEERWETVTITENIQPDKPDYQRKFLDEIPPETAGVRELPEEQPVLQKKPTKWYVNLFLKILSVLVIIGFLEGITLWIRNRIYNKKYAKADNLEKVQMQFKRLLRLGKLQGIPWSDAETLWAYGKRARTVLDTGEYSFAHACAAYEKIRFGGKCISAAELKELETYAGKLECEYLANCGRLRQFMYRVL